MKAIRFFVFAFALMTMSVSVNAYDFEVDGIYYTILSRDNQTCEVSKGKELYTGNITIPSMVKCNQFTYSVVSIGNSAFADCKDLTSIRIPTGVTSIGDNAFQFCSKLKDAILSNSIKTIGKEAFHHCYNLKSINLPNSIETIGQYAFYNCESIELLVLPNNLKEIAQGTFQACESLKSIVISNGLKKIGEHAFGGCEALSSITLPNSVADISQYAFSGSGLTSIVIPENVNHIYGYVFQGCASLQSVTLHESVWDIRDGAFMNCYSLTEIKSLNITPPGVRESSFEGVSKTNCIIKVPEESVEEYKSRTYWNDFWNIISIQGGDVDVKPMEQCKTPIISVKDGKVVVSCDTENAICHTSIDCGHNQTYNLASGGGFDLNNKITIISYATADGMYDSDFATMEYIQEPELHEVHDTTYVNVEIHDTTYVNIPPAFIKLTTEINGIASAVVNVAKDSTAVVELDIAREEWIIESVSLDGMELSIVDTGYITPPLTTDATIAVRLRYNGEILTNEELSSGLIEPEWMNLNVYTQHDKILVTGLAEGDSVTLFTPNGMCLASGTAHYDSIEFIAPTQSTYLLSICHAGKRLGVKVRLQ